MASQAGKSTGPPGGQASAALLLSRQFKQMQTDKDIPGISCGLEKGSVFDWEIMLMLDEEQDSLYGGEWRRESQSEAMLDESHAMVFLEPYEPYFSCGNCTTCWS